MVGHPIVKVPNLDRLARDGITFTNAFAEGLPTIQARRTCFTGIRSFPWRFEMGSRGLTPAIPGWHRMPDEQTALGQATRRRPAALVLRVQRSGRAFPDL